MQYNSQLLIQNQTPEDFIYSQINSKQENVSTNSQMKTQIKHSIELLKQNLINGQIKNDYSNSNQHQLVFQLIKLQQNVRNSEKQFIKKELYLQEQILKAQKNFEKTMNFMKFKYQMQIQNLNSELKVKDEEICSLNLQLQQNNLNKIGKSLFSSQQLHGEQINTESYRKSRKLKMPTRSQNTSRKEDMNKHQKELRRIRIQTSEFAQQVEYQKNQIQSDIAILQDQKQVLQFYLNLNKIQRNDRTQNNSPIKLNNNEINKQSISSFGVKEYFSQKQ